jgi:cell volume regulation protein A
MELHLPVDDVVLLGAAVIVVGVVTAALAGQLRVPSLLVFLGLGMALADDGLGLVHLDDPELVQSIAVGALVLILFEGGLGLDLPDVKKVAAPAVLLATVGVGISAAVVAGAALLLFDVSGTTAWLLAAVVASTDAAAVMSILKRAPVPERLHALLEVESGLNDPIAALLTVGILETWTGDATPGGWVVFALQQVLGGIAAGVGVGLVGAWLAERIRLGGVGLVAVLSTGLAGLAYGLATQVGGSGLLAVFLVGLVLGHRLTRYRHTLRTVHEGFAFAAQMSLFTLLGVQVFPSELPDVAWRGLLMAVVLVFVARPLASLAIVPWFRLGRGATALVGWVGLRGAVPIVLATFPLTAEYPEAHLVFNVVFFVVFLSVAVQGATIAPFARRLGLQADHRPATTIVTGLDHVAADVIELTLDESAAVVGFSLAAAPMPEGVRASLVVRDGRAVVPHGDTILEAGDTVVAVAASDSRAEPLLQAWARGDRLA